ncbi:MAG: carboxypeptidase-like regulatory domain-containing protein [Flavobacteriaceae bacterium]|nr:carboxypeptidase-like regulatory domain-containing protein [Flavobacteriaceae bacterium]
MVNGITEVLTTATIPEGNYDTVRLYISSTKMQMNSGETFTYETNQSNMSGGMMGNGLSYNNDTGSIDISLDHLVNVQMGSDDEFLMDVDIDHSFMLEGLSFSGMGNGMMSMTGFTFNPTMRFVNLAETGSIYGFVHMGTDGLADVNISLMQNGEVYTSTHTDDAGHYQMIGIPSGTYIITAEADSYMMNSTGNDSNMGTMHMTAQDVMSVDFDMIEAN